MDRPKRVLMISYHFPPRAGIASVRSGGLAKYLPAFGWETCVLTPHLPERPTATVRVIETDMVDVIAKWKRRLGFNAEQNIHETFGVAGRPHSQEKHWKQRVIALGREVLAYPDACRGWLPFALAAARDVLRTERFDAILSTAPPPTAHMIAHRLKKEFNVPWVADYRDLWTQYHYYAFSPVRKTIERRLERATLSCADAITTISDPLAATLASLHRQPVHTIRNGFDLDEMSPPASSLSAKFTVVHTGQLYQGKRDPSSFLKALSQLIDAGEISAGDVDVRFYGPLEPWLEHMIDSMRLRGVVKQEGTVPRQMAVEAQRSAHLLLLLTWDHPAEEGVYTGKVFEYLAARRPVISVGRSGGVIEDLLRSTKTGVAFSSDNLNGVRESILEAYRNYRANGSVPYAGDLSVIEGHSHWQMARRFAGVLNQVCGG